MSCISTPVKQTSAIWGTELASQTRRLRLAFGKRILVTDGGGYSFSKTLSASFTPKKDFSKPLPASVTRAIVYKKAG